MEYNPRLAAGVFPVTTEATVRAFCRFPFFLRKITSLWTCGALVPWFSTYTGEASSFTCPASISSLCICCQSVLLAFCTTIIIWRFIPAGDWWPGFRFCSGAFSPTKLQSARATCTNSESCVASLSLLLLPSPCIDLQMQFNIHFIELVYWKRENITKSVLARMVNQYTSRLTGIMWVAECELWT